jgi:hypothetical protein
MLTPCRLPSLKKELTYAMRRVQANIDQLPSSFPDDPQARLTRVCNDFVLEIDQHAHGNQKHPKFLQDMHTEFWKFAKAIAATRPTFEIDSQSTSDGSILRPILAYIDPSSVGPETSLCAEGTGNKTQSGMFSCTIVLTHSHIARVSAGHNSSKVNSRTSWHHSFYRS